MNKKLKQELIIFIALIIISLPFRLYHFTYPLLDAFNFRQTQTATFALNFYKYGINLFHTQLNIFGIGREKNLILEFPLYEAIVTVFYKLFFFSEIWGRAVSIAAGYITAWYLYKFIDLLIQNRKLAFLTALFYLFTPLNMFYQRSFMIDPFIIAFLTAGLYYACEWILQKKDTSFIFSTIILSLGFMQKGLYGPFWLLPLLTLYISQKRGRFVFDVKLLLLILTPLIALFLWNSYMNASNISNGQQFFTTANKDHLIWNFGTLTDRLSANTWLYRLKQLEEGIFLKPGLLLFFLGLINIKKFKNMSFFYYFLLSQIIYFLIVFRIQAQNYYQLVMVPSLAPFIANGLLNFEFLLKYIVKRVHMKSPSYLITGIISVICSLYIYKSWLNILPSFYIDWQWYQSLQNIGKVIPSASYAILAVPGNDWSSAYSYYSGRIMKSVGAESVNQANIDIWKKSGYSFIILQDYKSYPGYFQSIKHNSSLDILFNYKEVLDSGGFKIYRL